MRNNLVKSESSFSFHFDGGHEIDALLLCKAINDMAELTQLAAQAQDPDIFLKVNVTAFKNGSFEIDFAAICEVARNLFNSQTEIMAAASGVVEVVKKIFEIKKFLKGEPAKEIRHVHDKRIEIKNNDGSVMYAPESSGAVMNNVRIDHLTQNISVYCMEHNDGEGFSITTDDGVMHCSKEDVKNIMKPMPIEEVTTCKRYIREANLTIKKADFMGRSAWDFMLEGRTIHASMADSDFLEKVHSGQVKITAGDWLRARLEIYVDLDLMGNPIDETSKYTLTNVIGDIHSSESTQIEF